MRILHTSDWHLGATLEQVSREEDHAFFLDWLLGTLEDQSVDVLVVAGDIFDQAQPSAEAQRAYYRFLHRAARTQLRQLVVVGGNHDSASRLDAPRELLGAFGVHVVGGLESDEASWDRCLCTVRRGAEVELVVLAVPYVHEWRLGVRTVMTSEDAIRDAFRERFSRLYTGLADRGAALGGGAPLLATGHLACVGGERGDAPVEIHLCGSSGGVPPEVFDPRIAHVALGHFHRMFRVGASRAWYCGTPVALNAREGASARHVLLVQPEGGAASVEPLDVPELRGVLDMRGALDELVEAVRAMRWPTPRPPLLSLTVQVEGYAPGVEAHLRKALQGKDRPALVRVVQQQVGEVPGADETPPPALRELSEEDVFRLLCQARGEPVDSALLAAFRTLRSDPGAGAPGGAA